MAEIEMRSFQDDAEEPHVRGYLHRPAKASGDGLVLTHGAGGNCESALLVSLATAFCEAGVTVLRCDLPFRQSRPHGPPMRGSAERDQAGLRRAVEAMRKIAPWRALLGGHSYGGRQASMLAAAEPSLVNALLLLSYPLHPPKKRDEIRAGHFPSLRTPALFVHGMRDGFGTSEELEAALTLIPTRTESLPIQSAGHKLLSAKNRSELPTLVAAAFLKFVGDE